MSVIATGARLGPYEMISPAGAGGMGEVWKARDTRVDRIVAVKISQKQFSERFEREARATAALNHPNICSLYDVGPDYLVMEYVDGAPIRPVQGARKLLDLAVQIADGMAAAHARGITHRDLKPDNILITNDGRVKILDFGLAKLNHPPVNPDATQAVTVTHPGMVVGTVAYMSPEQARGLPLDGRSDQFSFGAILYELACGKRPFSCDSAPQTMAAIIEADPEPLPHTVPAPMRWIIERCLAKEPLARYESTRDLYRELVSLREHISEVSSTTVAAHEEGIVTRHWPRWIGASAIVLAVAGIAYWLGVRERPTPEPSTPVPLTSSGGIALNPSFSPDGSEVVFAWNGLRGNHHNLYVKLIGSTDLLRLTTGEQDEISPAWSPDGQRIAFVRSLGHGKRALLLISPLGGAERKLAEISLDEFGPEGHAVLAWSPNGRYLAAVEGNGFDLISADTGERHSLWREGPGITGDADPAFSPDGSRMAFVRRLGPFTSRPLWVSLAKGYQPSGKPHEILTPGMVAYSPLWERPGQLLLACGAPFGMQLYRVGIPAGAPVRLGSSMVGGSLAFHSSTHRLLFTSLLNIENLYRAPILTPGKLGSPERLTSTSGTDFVPRYSPDGRTVAFASFRFARFGLWTIQTETATGSELVDWGEGLAAATDWSPDGKSFLMFATGPQGLYQIYRVWVDTRKVTRLMSDSFHDVYPTFSRDGRFIYYTSTRQGQLRLFKMPAAGGAGAPVSDLSVVFARESADGHWLYFADWMPGGLYRMPLAGGSVTPVATGLADPGGYDLAGEGIYFWTGSKTSPALSYVDLATGNTQLVMKPSGTAVPSLTISPDGRWLCYPATERVSQELMLIEKFSD